MEVNKPTKHYDMIIMGAGPAGLSMAHCCSSVCKNILVVDKENAIGGCHRVKRVKDGMFTEHSPRVYFDHYVNFFHLLDEIGLNKDDIFTKYYVDYGKMIGQLSLSDLWIFTVAYITFLFNENYGLHVSLKDFCKQKKLSNIDFIDKICRYIDGATIERYSLNKFLQISDGMAVKVLQPTGPLDKVLFNKWQKFLEEHHVDFALGKDVTHIEYNNAEKRVKYIILNKTEVISCDKLVLAMPPSAITKVLYQQKHIQNCFGDFKEFEDWSEKTEYLEIVSITYHFKEDIKLPMVEGLTFDTDWGVLSINLSDYMQDIEDGYTKVISIALTICDKPSKVTGRTVNQSTKDDLIREAFRQLKASLYPDLPDDYVAVLNPNNYYVLNENKWESSDEAYFHTVHTDYIPNTSQMIENIYNVGTHNGNSYVYYTTLESAVSNAIHLSYQMYPELRPKYKLRKYTKTKDVLRLIMLILFILIVFYLLYKLLKK
jgi:hypothetical protein